MNKFVLRSRCESHNPSDIVNKLMLFGCDVKFDWISGDTEDSILYLETNANPDQLKAVCDNPILVIAIEPKTV